MVFTKVLVREKSFQVDRTIRILRVLVTWRDEGLEIRGRIKTIHHHHHVAPPARISLTLSRHFSYHSSPPAGLQGYILCTHIVAVCKFVLVVHSCTSMCGGPQEYVAYELVLASPAVSCVSGSSNLYSFRDGGQVSVELESRGVLSPALFKIS